MVRRYASILYGSSGIDEEPFDVPSLEKECRFLGSLRWSFGDFSFRRCTSYEVSLSCRAQCLIVLADHVVKNSGDTHTHFPFFPFDTSTFLLSPRIYAIPFSTSYTTQHLLLLEHSPFLF